MTDTVTPVAPKPAASPILTFRHHLILLVLAAVLVTGSVYGVEGVIARHDLENSTKWNSILQTQTAQTVALQKQIASDEEVAAIRDAAYQKTISQLAQTISVRNAQTQQQVKNDASLNAQQAAIRLATQTNAQAGEIGVAGDTISLDLPITRNIISNLDLLETAQADLSDTEKQLAAQQGLTADAAADDNKQKSLVAALQTEVLDSDKACLAQVKTLKAQNRKSKIKIFFVGYVAGFISGVTAHLW